ncbi:MAG TPA: DNA topoisomerase I [Pyrodictium sp.]|nr:DNA topoisomerase I [Pyrodictium sp.]
MYIERCFLPPSYTLIIAEKPKAAERIAEALGRPRKCSMYGVPFWVLKVGGSYYVVASAAGHLFGLTTSENGFPVFDYYWAPLWQIDLTAKHTKKFLLVLEFLCKKAKAYINACDYDIEGSVIGYLIIKSFGDLRRAYRMKFSTLTVQDIRRAFRSLSRLDWEMIEAGLARHELDWLWGINISRALMEAVRRVAGKRVSLSAGRVQSPTLIEAARRCYKINLHVPLPYYNVRATLEFNGWRKRIVLVSSIETRGVAEKIAKRLQDSPYLRVVKVRRRLKVIPPPPPFNLGDLQLEAARIYKLSPYKTQEIAEKLYLDALISYPRTNSQKIPPTIDVRSIVLSLTRSPIHGKLAAQLLAETRGFLKPRQGEKDDPAHPAIHPTGNIAVGLKGYEAKIYDLIVRRFLASMARPLKLEETEVELYHPSGVKVRLKGVVVVDEGWLKYYPYASFGGDRLPTLTEGDVVRIRNISVVEEYTEPPQYYTRASLVKWMEGVGIGTEATRARIVETLFERGYLKSEHGKVVVTDLGYAVAEVLTLYFPQLTSVQLTREFEKKLEAIRRRLTTRQQVVLEAKKLIKSLVEEYKATAIEKVGEYLAASLGLIKTVDVCRVCGRAPTVDGVFCRFHADAYKKLVDGYKLWVNRVGYITPREYLLKLVKLRQTGRWIKEMAYYLLKTGAKLEHFLK